MKTVLDLKSYTSPRSESSFYKGIPIEYLDITRKILKSKGYTCKIRYRGPRAGRIRSPEHSQSYCLKDDATSFAVYRR